MTIDQFLASNRLAAEIDLELNDQMLSNNIARSQEVIGNIAALQQLQGADPLATALSALQVAAANPTSSPTEDKP